MNKIKRNCDKENYSKYEAKEEFGTLSFNHVLLHKRITKKM